MNKLSKEKRNQLILVVLITAMAAAGLWFGPISIQRATLAKTLGQTIPEKQADLAKKRQELKEADRIATEATEATNKIATIEENMPSGDLFAWMVSNLRIFKLPYKLDIQQTVLADGGAKPMNLIPKFPYQQATFTVAGTAYFHDFGKFIADLENHFPYFRVLNIDLQPEPAAAANEKASVVERERLAFKFDIITLVKPTS